jgi:hypothetical protein
MFSCISVSRGLRVVGAGVAMAMAAAASVLLAGQPHVALAADVARPAGAAAAQARWGTVPRSDAAAAAAATPDPLIYRGSVNGSGVTIGRPRVYLVFWGSQWGSATRNAAGDTVLSGDPNGAAPYLQRFFRGLGSGGETWSGVMTQYCQGVAAGATSCYGPFGTSFQHVGYPTGGALAGVWADSSAPAPAQATHDQIAAEAIAAAQHLGLTSPAANRSVQYDILSPTGTSPDGFPAGFCAWHSSTPSAYGDIAFTNMPYVTDSNGCGISSVNAGSAGVLDGFSIVNGHEYAETITDQHPGDGWLTASGAESGDPCAWLGTGGGRIQDIVLTTGTFAVQGIWSNSAGGCEISHPVIK